MLFKPRKEMHFSRRTLGLVFLGCGGLLTTQHLLAGIPLLLLAGLFLYFAPSWNLRIEMEDGSLRFSENVLEPETVELEFSALAEIRRVSEETGPGGFLGLKGGHRFFVEFETRGGKVYRMHDIFPAELDEAISEEAGRYGVQVKDLTN